MKKNNERKMKIGCFYGSRIMLLELVLDAVYTYMCPLLFSFAKRKLHIINVKKKQ